MAESQSVAHQRLNNRLQEFFGELYRFDQKNPSEFYTRALASLFLTNELEVKSNQVKKFIIDGKSDNQVDGIYYDRTDKVIYFIQSKYKADPKKGLALSDVTKFTGGVEQIITGKALNPNAKLRKLLSDVDDAITDFETRVVVVIVTNSSQDIAADAEAHIKNFIERKNEGVEDIFSYQYLNISQAYNLARHGPGARSVDVDFDLVGCGHVKEPYLAYYGAISGKTLHAWYKRHERKLLKDNVRYFLFDTDVNIGIRDTVYKEPSSFWYFNNGITATAKEVKLSAKGIAIDGRTSLHATSLSIVNGAQTLGTIGNITEAEKLGEVLIPFRVISLEQSPPQFEELVTRATNTQNELQAADFVSLDPIHDTIRSQLATKNISYKYRRGDEIEDKETSFDLREAAVALACAQGDLSLAVQAKRYFSGLLRAIDKEPYTLIFNSGTKPDEVWNVVRIYRLVEYIGKQNNGDDALAKQIIAHSDKFVAHVVFSILKRDKLTTENALSQTGEKLLADLIKSVVVKTVSFSEQKYKTVYPGNIFKNLDMQKEIKAELLAKLKY